MDLQEEPCKQTDVRETCLVLGSIAKKTIRSRSGRELSRSEMLALLDQADDAGMVLQAQNTQDPNFICCCCGCCCGVLHSAKHLPRPAEYFDTNFGAVVDPELCTECETCADRCQMEAITYVEGIASIDILRCIGCGLCVTTCSGAAIQLFEKAETKTPPKSQGDLYKKIMKERFGVMGTAKIVGKKILGLKI